VVGCFLSRFARSLHWRRRRRGRMRTYPSLPRKDHCTAPKARGRACSGTGRDVSFLPSFLSGMQRWIPYGYSGAVCTSKKFIIVIIIIRNSPRIIIIIIIIIIILTEKKRKKSAVNYPPTYLPTVPSHPISWPRVKRPHTVPRITLQQT